VSIPVSVYLSKPILELMPVMNYIFNSIFNVQNLKSMYIPPVDIGLVRDVTPLLPPVKLIIILK
jgi:hypothetical protein